MITLDERRGVPSASGAPRLVNCPPSFKMEQASPKEPESDDAASGTRIHNVLAGLAEYDSLTADEQQTHDMCERQKRDIITEWGAWGVNDDGMFEVRLGLTDCGCVEVVTPDSTLNFVFTGQADMILFRENQALIIDYKTGRGDYEDAVDNSQLASLAVLVAGYTGAKHVRVALVQPWTGKPTVADYTPDSLVLAKSWLLTALEAAKHATPDQAEAGDHCKWCRAKLTCPAFNHRLNQNLEVVDPLRISGLAPKEQGQAMWAMLMEVSPERLIAAVNGLPFHKRFIHAVESTFFARVEAGEIPGYRIETKQGNREITDAQAAFNALQPLGITSEDVLAACKLPLGAMEEAARRASGIKSQTPGRTTYNLTAQQAKDSVNAALEAAGAIGRKAEGKQIVRIESAIEEGES